MNQVYNILEYHHYSKSVSQFGGQYYTNNNSKKKHQPTNQSIDQTSRQTFQMSTDKIMLSKL